jgi:hypothetical protein
VLQQIETIVSAAVSRVEKMQVARLEVVDGGDAESVAAVLGAFPMGVARVLAETCRAIGVDPSVLVAPAEHRALKGGGQ